MGHDLLRRNRSLISLLLMGMPPAPFIGFIVLEIIGAPFFIWWQARIAR
jgi:hypothetical protein